MPKILKKFTRNGVDYLPCVLFPVTEDLVTVTTDSTKGVAPYNVDYWYTNIAISSTANIAWVEWAVYAFVVDTKMAVASANRNVRVKIGNGSYIPVMGSSDAILAGSSYFKKAQTRLFVFKTTNQSGGALHMLNDTTYSSMSAAEGKTGTATSARVLTAANLKTIIEYYITQHAPTIGNATITLVDQNNTELWTFTTNATVDKTITINTGGGGGGLDVETTNALIDVKLWEFDSLFKLTTGLYQILNDYTDEDELGLTDGDTRQDIVEDATNFSLLTHSYTVFNMVANSNYALSVVMADGDAVDEVLECWNSATLIADNKDAASLFLNDATILAKILASSVGKDAFFSSEVAWDIILWDQTLMQTIIGSTTYMADIVNIPVAMQKIADSVDAMEYILTQSSILALVVASGTAINVITKSQIWIWVLTSSSNNTTLQNNVVSLYNLVTGDAARFKQITRTYQDAVANLNSATKTKNCIVFTATGYRSSSSYRTNVYHANGVLAKSAAKTNSPTSVTASNVDVVSFTGCTYTETNNGQAAIAVYQAI